MTNKQAAAIVFAILVLSASITISGLYTGRYQFISAFKGAVFLRADKLAGTICIVEAADAVRWNTVEEIGIPFCEPEFYR